MDARCLDYCVTEEERLKFERDGFFVLENVLPEDLVDELVPVVDRVDGAYREREGMGPNARSNMLDFIGQDDLFLELLDWYKTFSKGMGVAELEYSALPFSHDCDAARWSWKVA